MKRSWFIRLLVMCLVVVAIILFISVPVRIVRYGKAKIVPLEAAQPGIVIIFGAGLESNGTPSDALDDRLQVGAELFAAGKATQIFVSGDNRVENYKSRKSCMTRSLPSTTYQPSGLLLISAVDERTIPVCGLKLCGMSTLQSS